MAKARQRRRPSLLKTSEQLDKMRQAGRMLAKVRESVVSQVRPGVSTADLDDLAREMIVEAGATPAFLGYHGFPGTICASINEEVVHGIPNARRVLEEGDLISVDVGLILDGWYSDTAVTIPVGTVSEEVQRLIDVTRESLNVGIRAALPGKRLGDVSSAIQKYAEGEGFSVVREYTGHGIGQEMHEEPKIPNYGPAGRGMRLQAGMVMALEPMVNLGVWNTKVLEDDWTVVTQDGRPSAHFEHTIALTENGVETLTE